MMRNRDLVAYLKPVKSRLGRTGAVEFLDLSGRVTDIESSSHRLLLRPELAAGLYRMSLRTRPQAFDMSTASVEMVRVPDGERVLVGPWDLDHVHNVMALPMARVFVNGELKGGLWFAMPGPAEIAEGRLSADFGFEAVQGRNEIVLELIERDRERIGWDRLESAELREDDRRCLTLHPRGEGKPRLFMSLTEAGAIAARWAGRADFSRLIESLRRDPLTLLTDDSQGTMSLAMMMYALTGDRVIGERAHEAVMELAIAETWSGRPDPLLMGGDNDRGISLRLFHVALAWEFLQPLLGGDDRAALLAKAEEYLQKMYDFTLLQRAYMGYPAIDPHSLGSWNGTGIACMAFYDELAIARKALPFFHGLFVDSLSLFPESGKAAWATYFPFHLVLYLAAASTFSGPLPEVAESRFLHHLGNALLTSYASPNSQELQRGLRTREHRFLTAFLCRFHPTQEIEAIYRTFFHLEMQNTGDVWLGIFDLLYAPNLDGATAELRREPLYARDVGDVIASSESSPRVSISMSAGAKAGRRASFTLMPQNREFAPSMGAFEAAVDGTPVLCNINISSYGINSALTNTLCLEDGGGVTNGQYLNGSVQPEQCGVMRRYFCGDRFLYTHVNLAYALAPSLQIESAERVLIFDRRTGAIVIADSFSANRPLQFATHLHCSGSATAVSEAVHRLTGGQADLIAGMKGGSKGLGNEEKGELYVQVLATSAASRVITEEPTWIPGYIYGLNLTGNEKLCEASFPRYTRWRLELQDRTPTGSLLFGLSSEPGMLSPGNDGVMLPEGCVAIGPREHSVRGVSCTSEAVLWDERAQELTAIGLTSLVHAERSIIFAAPVDLVYAVGTQQGRAFAASQTAADLRGFGIGAWVTAEAEQSLQRFSAEFISLHGENERSGQ